MKFDESNEFQMEVERDTKKKTVVLISIVFCAILAALLFILIIVIQKQDAVTFKMFLNDKQIGVPAGFMIDMGDKGLYVNVQTLGELLQYKYQKGEYQKFNENEDSCSLQNTYEVIAITADKEYYTKYTDAESEITIGGFEKIVFENPNGYSEDFYIEKPIILSDGSLYASLDILPKMFNININFSNPYRLKLYSFDFVVANASARLGKAQIYDEISGTFENMKAMVDGYIVVRSGNLYGIVKDGDFQNPILGVKYKNIQYIQSMDKFYVTTDKDIVGLVDSDGKQIIDVDKTEYSDVSIFDSKHKLYLVKKNAQYGIVNEYGAEVIVPEYDRLGIDVSKFTSDNLTNGNIIYGECIPFYKENENGEFKYGLLDLYGTVILSNFYDDLGYKSLSNSTSNTRDRSILLIPESEGIKGIIVMQNDHFGIYNVATKSLATPVAFNKIYIRTLDGVTNYYMEDGAGNTFLLKDYLVAVGIIDGENETQPADEELVENN